MQVIQYRKLDAQNIEVNKWYTPVVQTLDILVENGRYVIGKQKRWEGKRWSRQWKFVLVKGKEWK